MKTSTIVIAVIVLALIAGGVYYFSEEATAPVVSDTPTPSPSPTPTPTPTPTPSNEPDAFVTFSDSGYSPSSVTIKKGQKVRFMNNSNRDFWPASAIHPTHSVYPQKSLSDCLGSSFDACRATPPGGNWEFQFNEVGTWRYHDHLSANRTGTIVVTE